METIRNLFKDTIFKEPLSFIYNSNWNFIRHLLKDDKTYLSFLYWSIFHKKIDWDNPKTFNEKMQWLKLYNHKPIYVTMADKVLAKEFVAKKIGSEHVVPCYGTWDRAEDIDFDSLPDQFVLKCNHNSGLGRCICSNKKAIDIEQVRKGLEAGLKEDYYLPGRDKQYRDIKRKILAEKYLDDHTGTELRDYKFWCFDGKPKYMYCTNKGKHIKETFYDMDFNPIGIDHGFPRISPELKRPDEFEEMKRLATILSEGMPFIRIDFFDVNGVVYFGEFTFFDWGGLKPFKGDWDIILGELIKLPR